VSDNLRVEYDRPETLHEMIDWLVDSDPLELRDLALNLLADVETLKAQRDAALAEVSELKAIRDRLMEEREFFREHSMTLNTVCYRIVRALNGGQPEATYIGSPVADTERLIAQHHEANALLVEERGLHAATRAELAEANAKIERLRWSAIYTPGRRCRFCGGRENEHRMSCRHYVGPLEHQMTLRGINPSFGGWDYDCTCGRSARVGRLAGDDDGRPVCPAMNETWRGPAVDGLTADGAGTAEGGDGG
jgi:hypothetical protein